MTVVPFQSPDDVRRAVSIVRDHLDRAGLLAYPTETVYGLGSRPAKDDVDRLARLKGREPGKPFLLLVSSRAMAERYGLRFTAQANVLAETFWPGPLTLVLSGGEGRLPDSLRGPEGGIAVRHTSHAGMATLIQAVDLPVTSTSANRKGGAPAPGAAAVTEAFPGPVQDGTLLVLDGGVLGNVPPSTVIDCTTPEPRLVREGAIPRAELRRRAGRSAP